MTEIKTTQKDLYNRIMAEMNYDEEVVAFCQKKLDQLARNAARPRKTKVNLEAEQFRADVLAKLAEKDAPVTNKEMAAEFGVSAQKMSAALRMLVKDGKVERIEPEKKSGAATFQIAE